jgi:hypothetical protein
MLFSDFKGNYNTINTIKSILSNNRKGIYTIVGDNGTGKSSIGICLCTDQNNDVLVIDETNYSEAIVKTFICHNTIKNMFHPSIKIVFIDDVNLISHEKTLAKLVNLNKENCIFFCTIRTNEEKKITLLKFSITQRLELKVLNYKDCYQFILSTLPYHEDDVNLEKLIKLVKNLNSNIPKIMMMLDSCLESNDFLRPFEELPEKFDKNIYISAYRFFSKMLSTEELEHQVRNESPILSTMIHHNTLKLDFHKTNTDIKTLKHIYGTYCSSDIIDKHVYVNCNWETLYELNVWYKYSTINKLIHAHYKEIPNLEFSKHFTKLSTQTAIRKKLLELDEISFIDHPLSYLNYLSNYSYEAQNDSLIKKYDKDFKSIKRKE